MIRAVLDTNVLVSATFWKGPPHEVTLLAAEQKIIAFTSAELLEEYAGILKRDFGQEHGQTEEKLKAALMFLKVAKPAQKINAIKEDPDDNKVLEAAVGAFADYIVSGDRHLLELGEFGGIKIVNARQFLEMAKGR